MNTPSIISVLVVSLGLFMAGPARAVLIKSQLSSDSQTGFDHYISTDDLIQYGASSLESVDASAQGTFSYTGANNGNAAHTTGLSFWENYPGTVTLTYYLTGSATGYDITSVNSIYGWQNVRYRHAAQRYEVLVKTLLNPVFTQIAAVDYHPWADSDFLQGSTKVTLTDNTGSLATGVTAIQFLLRPYIALNPYWYTGEIGVVREFDVFGSASVAAVPEPATLALFAVAFAGLLVSRRRVA